MSSTTTSAVRCSFSLLERRCSGLKQTSLRDNQGGIDVNKSTMLCGGGILQEYFNTKFAFESIAILSKL